MHERRREAREIASQSAGQCVPVGLWPSILTNTNIAGWTGLLANAGSI